jgi:tRNA_anti-like
MLNKLLPVLVIGVGLLLASTVSSCSSTPTSASSSPTPSYSANDATTVTAPALSAAYKKHKAASDRLYKGKLLRVTGTIDEVGTDPIFQAPEVVLSNGATTQATGVDCIFETKYAAEVAKLQKGATLAVLGTCDGYAVNVLLLHCQPSQK